MKTRIIALAVTAACASAAVAQSQYEALQFMGNELNGTARFVGMGGAIIIHVPMQILQEVQQKRIAPVLRSTK